MYAQISIKDVPALKNNTQQNHYSLIYMSLTVSMTLELFRKTTSYTRVLSELLKFPRAAHICMYIHYAGCIDVLIYIVLGGLGIG